MKDRTVMRADLRTDLKDSGALWSDSELNRCIEKAVADLSRFMPREKTYEETLDFDIVNESVTFPVNTDPDRIVDAVTFNAKVAGNTFTITAQPDVPRVITFLVTDADASITDFHIRVDGTDEEDLGVSEDFYFGNGLSQTGKQIFKRVHAVTLVETFGGTAAAGDVLDIGVGAYTNVWVSLAYKPVKHASESGTDAASNAMARDTDYRIDYVKGKVKAISGGDIAAAEVCTFDYTKDQTSIDLSSLDDFIRVYRTEYPVGNIPQSFCQTELYGRHLFITGLGESEEQSSLMEGKNVRVYYDAAHHPPSDFAPGTIPEFLENTIEMAASAYALFIYSLKNEHQALTDLATARTAIAAAEAAQAAIVTVLTSLATHNTSAATALAAIDALHAAVVTALDAANIYADTVATDLTNADAVAASYIAATDYVGGATEPGIKAYLTTGDALINTITSGGENEKTPEMYGTFAQITKSALVSAYEQHRAFYQQNATARSNTALAYVQEASQRVANMRIYADTAEGYVLIASNEARDVEARIAQIASYLQEAAHSIEVAGGDLIIADKFRTEAIERRNEVWNIWRDRKEYIGNFATSAMNQMVTTSRFTGQPAQ